MRENLPLVQGQRLVDAYGVRWSVNIQVIERVRIVRGWTKADVDPGTLSDMTLGRRRPTFGTMQAICVALGLVLSEVIVLEDDRAA